MSAFTFQRWFVKTLIGKLKIWHKSLNDKKILYDTFCKACIYSLGIIGER